MLPIDYKSDQQVRWCPGCGDHAILNSLIRAMADLGVPPYKIALISGIGCSSRIPHYVNTYGFNTIHGRGAAIATGVKVANPDVTVWQASGDGDCLAIGGNHFIHAIRRNVDINLLIFNNQIYGLTKGQYSPTSPKGFVSKSSPFGTVERPFRPAELVMGARGTFFARTVDTDMQTTQKIMKAAANHKGYSVCECLTHCVIFNKNAHDKLTTKEQRLEHTILLEDGKPMIFGKDRDKGLILKGLDLQVVTLGKDGVTENDLLIHDPHNQDPTIHLKLALMDGDELPIALGVIRDVEEETYEEAVVNQIKEVQERSNIKTFDDLMGSLEQWTL